MEYLKDVMAALSVILNGLPQGLLALSFGFASIPTALAFLVGAVGCVAFSSVAPISFQAETITLAGTMGSSMRERLSMIFYGAAVMALIGVFGLLEKIVIFVGPAITSGMMAGVGIMLARVAIEMSSKNRVVGLSSIASGFAVYMLTRDLVYTITLSVVLSTVVSLVLRKTASLESYEKETFTFQKPMLNGAVVRGALAMVCLNIGANIAFGKLTGNIAGADVNVDHLAIYSSLADMASSLFGGGPVETIISATGSAPHPVFSGVLMMGLMAAILFAGLLPKIGRFVPSESIAGFLFVLGAIVTVPVNAAGALAGDGSIVGGITLTVTAITDPFIGMMAGLVVKIFSSFAGF